MALRRARAAELMDHFGWLPEAIGGLTERQIVEYALHAREETGAIRRPRPKAPQMSCEQHVRAVQAMGRKLGLDPAATARKVEEIRAHYARKAGAEKGDG